MAKKQDGSPDAQELAPLNVIRVETALSRFPVHRLAKQGEANIEICERSDDGEVLIKWEVSHNSRYGQPGPLAYKLDTLIVNRRIEEATKPIGKLIKLGSLRDICHQFDNSHGENTNSVKRALHQNASAYITANLRYTLANGTTQVLEAGFNRYSVIFTGEKLPDGRTAEAVYIELSDRFMQVLNGAKTRPLDYDYLKGLKPAAQRLYEILSFQIYAALKYGRKDARLSYADFCTHAPLTRFLEWNQVRAQMYRIHEPHLLSKYIEGVKFEQGIGRDGKPDWLMVYTPGPRARAEYRAFTKRGGPHVLEVAVQAPALAGSASAEPTPLAKDLIARGVNPAVATELVASHGEEEIRGRIEQFDFLKEKQPKKVAGNPGGFLADSIRKGYGPPAGFESRAQAEARKEAEEARRRSEAEAARKKREETEQALANTERIKAHVRGLSKSQLEALDREALREASESERRDYEQSTFAGKGMILRGIRERHVGRLLELPEPASS